MINHRTRLIPIVILIGTCLISCQKGGKSLDDEALANIHCGSCHMFPDPILLDKSTWEKNILPLMGEYLGIDSPEIDPTKGMSLEALFNISRMGYFPKEPRLIEAEWEKVRNYFLKHAPEKVLSPQNPLSVQKSLANFRSRAIRFSAPRPSLTPFVEYDSLKDIIWASDMANQLYEISTRGKVLRKHATPSPVIDVIIRENGEYDWLSIGEILPTDILRGLLWRGEFNDNFQVQLEKLGRPVFAIEANVNMDERQDVVLSSFGNYSGKFAWYELMEDSSYQEHVLSSLAGAMKSEVIDINSDKNPDIIVLMGQGDEGIYAYINEGDSSFKRKALLRFPPVYGSSYFDLADMDKDGDLDIVYVNGDNADFSFSPKAYHGLRIFINDGNWNFTESYFAPVYGATKAVSEDFDLDGDLDIALIAFFPDFEQEPERGFLYFENQSLSAEWKFEVSTFKGSEKGRWLVMDVADSDKDGDQDILLGSFLYSSSPVPDSVMSNWKKDPLNLMILENKRLN